METYCLKYKKNSKNINPKIWITLPYQWNWMIFYFEGV